MTKNVDVAERNPLDRGLERFVGLEHLDPESLHIKRWGLVEEGTSFTRRFSKGQVLFGKRRTYQRKAAVAEWDGICSGDILVFEAREGLLPELLPFIVQSDGFFEQALRTSAGSLWPRTRWRDLEQYEFALPPKHEQRRITEIMWAADDAVQRFEEAVASAHVLHAALLTAVAVHAGASDAAVDGSVTTLMKLAHLVDPARPLCYGVVQPGPHNPSGVPLVRVCDMQGGTISVPALKRISPAVHHEYRRSVIKPRDILVSLVGTIGRVMQVPEDFEGFNIARAVARLAPNEAVLLPEYLLVVLTSQQLQDQFVSNSFETARKTLNLGELARIEVPVPPMDIQRKLLAPVRQLESYLHRLQAHLQLCARVRHKMVAELLRERG